MQTYENPNIDPQAWTWTPGQFTHRYGQEFSYDPSGNILTQDRLDHTGNSSGLIDELEYHYYPGSNRLEYVTNAQSGGANNRVRNQNSENYLYDESGNLIQDCSEKIREIEWNPSGKVSMIRIEPGATETIINFGYNALQQRVKKKVVKKIFLGSLREGLTEESDCFSDNPLEPNSIDTSILWYIRDATGNVLAVYEQMGDTMHWREQHLYGSSRLGMVLPGVKRYPGDGLDDGPYFIEESKEQPYGARRYEITNHLGNVTTVVSDRKVPIDDGGPITYEAAVHSAMDYNPFGSLMTERTFSAGGYRYGFNTQEKVDEVKGSGNHYSAEFWEYDPRVVHRWNIDPRPNPSMSPYAILGGNPIYHTDWAGDTTDVFNIHGDFQYTIKGDLSREQHFFTSGALKSITSESSGMEVRGLSEYFIGANTRASLDEIQQISNEENLERGFALIHYLGNRELSVWDVSDKVNLRKVNMIRGLSSAISSLNELTMARVIGHGHTHPDEAYISVHGNLTTRINNPSLTSGNRFLRQPQDYHPVGIRNHYTNQIGYNPAIILTSYGYTLYRTFQQPTQGVNVFEMNFPHSTSPIFNY